MKKVSEPINTKIAKIQHTKKALIEAMQKSLGVVTQACKIVGVDRGTFYNYYKSDEEFKLACDDCEEIAIDFAESQLKKNISNGDTTATIFYLKTKGKRRGYVERVEQQHSGGLEIKSIDPKKLTKTEIKALARVKKKIQD